MKITFPHFNVVNRIMLYFILFSTSLLFSQDIDTLVNTSSIPLNVTKNDSLIIIINRDTLKGIKVTHSLSSDLLFENWNDTKFNPYKDQYKSYPFYLKFTDSSYASPIQGKKVITSRYGWRKGRPHLGIDIDLVTGDQVMSMFDGVVRFVRYSSGHGKTIVIRHPNGLETAYAHLSKYKVKVNDTVQKGQIIGIGGTTGNARGSHLHLITSYKGDYINPEYLFDFGKENKLKKQNFWITKRWTKAHFHSSTKQSKFTYYNSYKEALSVQKKQSKRKVHVVKRGDTLSEISRKYKISLIKLCKTNAISIHSILKIGKQLIIY